MYPRPYCSPFTVCRMNTTTIYVLMVYSDSHLLPQILVSIVISAEVYYTEVFVAMTTHYVQNSTHRSIWRCLLGVWQGKWSKCQRYPKERLNNTWTWKINSATHICLQEVNFANNIALFHCFGVCWMAIHLAWYTCGKIHNCCFIIGSLSSLAGSPSIFTAIFVF